MVTVLDFANLFFGGMLAGIEFVIHYGIRGPAERLDDRAQIQLRQALVYRLRVLVPAFFVPTALSAVAVTIADRAAPGAGFRYAGALAMLVWIAVRVIGTVRINSASLAWQVDAPPKDWKQQIAAAERFHIVGVWAVVLAFVGFMTAAAVELTASP